MAYGSRGGRLNVRLHLVLFIQRTTLQTAPIHEDCVVVEVITVYTIFVDELLEYPPNETPTSSRTEVTVEKVSD
jgi:hypothetical protein